MKRKDDYVTDTTIESLRFVRAVVGFVRAGVFVQPVLSDRAARIVAQMNAARAQDAPVLLAQTQKILATVQSRILPSQADCSTSMAEIDAVLIPMRQARRAIEAAAGNPAEQVEAPKPTAKFVERG